MIKGLRFESDFSQLTKKERYMFDSFTFQTIGGQVSRLWEVCYYEYGRDFFEQEEIDSIKKLMELDLLRRYREGYYIINPFYFFEDEKELRSHVDSEIGKRSDDDVARYYDNAIKTYYSYPAFCEESVQELESWNEEMKGAQ